MIRESVERKWIPTICGIIGFLILLAIDRASKFLAVQKLKGQEPFVLVEGVFELRYLENQGAAFGILQGKQSLLLLITVIILAAIFYIYMKMPAMRRFLLLRILFILIAAGAVGNMIDRIAQGYVVDFFYFKLINFPIFNVADIYVTCSTIVLVLTILFYYKDEDFDRLAKSLKKQ